jgi:hypothetical protein
VQQSPQYLTVNNPEKLPFKTLAMSIAHGLDNIKDVLTPLEILKEKLSRSEIIKNQKLEYGDIYTKCLAGKNFEYITENSGTQEHYKLVSDLLFKNDGFYKILVPS